MAAVPVPWDVKVLSGYTLVDPLGSGAYGTVLGAYPRDVPGPLEAPPFAVKREQVFGGYINKYGEDVRLNAEHAKRIYREIVVMRHLNSRFSPSLHPNLVRLLDVRALAPLPAPDANAWVHLVMNNSGKSLTKLRVGEPETPLVTLTLPEVKDLAWQLLLGVYFMHTAGFVHRDM